MREESGLGFESRGAPAFDGMRSECGTIEKYFSEGLGIDAAPQEALRAPHLAPK